jgi:hypothetical protein
MAASSSPLWLKAVIKLERVIGEPVEKAVRSDTYFDLVSEARRNHQRVAHAVEGVSKRALHLLNLPAGTDIRRVREQLNRMERRLTVVTKELEDLQAAAAAGDDGRVQAR